MFGERFGAGIKGSKAETRMVAYEFKNSSYTGIVLPVMLTKQGFKVIFADLERVLSDYYGEKTVLTGKYPYNQKNILAQPRLSEWWINRISLYEEPVDGSSSSGRQPKIY